MNLLTDPSVQYLLYQGPHRKLWDGFVSTRRHLSSIFSVRFLEKLVRSIVYLPLQGASYKRYFYILESLALVKTFNVCLEVDAGEIIVDLFKLFFTIVSEEHNVRVKNFMLDILCPLLQESDSISQVRLKNLAYEIVQLHLLSWILLVELSFRKIFEAMN